MEERVDARMESPPLSHPHSHVFGQDQVRAGERRTIIVVIITAVMMVIEIAAGILFGSMALLADGLHMASHVAALMITWIAYVLARRHATDRRFSFGTGKVNSLGAFTSALLLAGFAALMAWESVVRFVNPVSIAFDYAILVAVVGLLVNAISAVILSARTHSHRHPHDHHHVSHDHDHDTDHNLRAAYLHVLADALTSLTAIFALVTGKFLGWQWMDPAMGVVGSALVARWSWGLLRDASRVLLDRQAPDWMTERIRKAVEDNAICRITDLHVWSIGPGIFGAAISVVATNGKTVTELKRLVPADLGLVHVTMEVHGE